MPREVSENAKYDDICFCGNSNTCNMKTCYRHMCHAAYTEWMSVAYFEGNPQYCLKAAKEKENEIKRDAKTDR